MPRPNRAQGRPGTQVFSKDWETSHAVAVGKSFRAMIKITMAPALGTAPELDASYNVVDPVTQATLYEGPARIQVLGSALDNQALSADQAVSTAGYLVVIDREADDIPVEAVVQILESTDPTLGGNRRLTVRKVARGSERWERDLWCVDDMTRQPT